MGGRPVMKGRQGLTSGINALATSVPVFLSSRTCFSAKPMTLQQAGQGSIAGQQEEEGREEEEAVLAAGGGGGGGGRPGQPCSASSLDQIGLCLRGPLPLLPREPAHGPKRPLADNRRGGEGWGGVGGFSQLGGLESRGSGISLSPSLSPSLPLSLPLSLSREVKDGVMGVPAGVWQLAVSPAPQPCLRKRRNQAKAVRQGRQGRQVGWQRQIGRQGRAGESRQEPPLECAPSGGRHRHPLTLYAPLLKMASSLSRKLGPPPTSSIGSCPTDCTGSRGSNRGRRRPRASTQEGALPHVFEPAHALDDLLEVQGQDKGDQDGGSGPAMTALHHAEVHLQALGVNQLPRQAMSNQNQAAPRSYPKHERRQGARGLVGGDDLGVHPDDPPHEPSLPRAHG